MQVFRHKTVQGMATLWGYRHDGGNLSQLTSRFMPPVRVKYPF